MKMDILSWLDNKNKKKKEEEETQAKKDVAEVREKAQKLLGELDAIDYSNPTHRFSDEDIDIYMDTIEALMDLLKKTPAAELDTREMDEEMVWIAQHFNKALEEGKTQVAEEMLTALIYGIVKGHESIPLADEGKIKEEMQERTHALQQYKVIATRTEEKSKLDEVIAGQRNEFKESQQEYDEKWDKIEAIENSPEYPTYEAFIENYNKDYKGILIPEAFELMRLREQVADLDTLLDSMKVEIDQNKQQESILEMQILNEKRMLQNKNYNIMDQLTSERFQQHQEYYIKRQQQLQETLDNLQEELDRFAASIEALQSPEVMMRRFLRQQRKWEEHLKKERQRLELKWEGQRMMHEKALKEAEDRAREQKKMEEMKEEQKKVDELTKGVEKKTKNRKQKMLL